VSLTQLILLASLLRSTTYGYGELMCGDIGKARKCSKGAVTASGVVFDPSVPMVAIAAPIKLRLRAEYIGLRVPGGTCQRVLLADKMNPRYIGKRGFDLNPAALSLITGEPAHKAWSGRVEVCQL
jgi:hypothetical protein